MPNTPPARQHLSRTAVGSNETGIEDAQNQGLISLGNVDHTALPDEIVDVIEDLANETRLTSLGSYEAPQNSRLWEDITVQPAKSDSYEAPQNSSLWGDITVQPAESGSYEAPQNSRLWGDITVQPAESDPTLAHENVSLVPSLWDRADPMICQTQERGSSSFRGASTSNTYGISQQHYFQNTGTQPILYQTGGNADHQGQTPGIPYLHIQAQGAQQTYDQPLPSENTFSEHWVDDHSYGHSQFAYPFDSWQERADNVIIEDLMNSPNENIPLLNNLASEPATSERLDRSRETGTMTIDKIVIELENNGVESGMLKECDLIVKYDNELVLMQRLTSLQEGYRIFFGNQNQQRYKLTSRYPPERCHFVNFNAIELPMQNRLSPQMSEILKRTDLGIVVQYEPSDLTIAATRLCQSHIFYYDPHDHSEDSEPVKLRRNVPVNVFSYAKYLEEHNSPADDPYARVSSISGRITFVVGVRPCSKMTLPKTQGLKIELIPYGAQILIGVKEWSYSPLCISEPTSLDTTMERDLPN